VTVPNVVGDPRDLAIDRLQDAGLTVSVSGQVDPTCNKVGEVIRQTPDGGTVVPRGTRVSIVVGVEPTTTACP
jgi:beta-lactam-binding protein with PASTA domain